MTEQSQEPKEGTRRYPRTFAGLVASLIVIVPVVILVVIGQNWHHGKVSDPTPAVDYLSDVKALQETPPGNLVVVYPTSLPSGWKATSVRVTTDDPDNPAWDLGIVTKSDEFAGLTQVHESIADLKKDHPDVRWSKELSGGYVVALYGSASKAEFTRLEGLLAGY